MAVDAEGSQHDTWLVRIIGAEVSASPKGKAQWKYAALLSSDYDPSSQAVCNTWHYAPMQKLMPLGPIQDINGLVVCNRKGTPKLSYNCARHHGDQLLAEWVPQSINTISRKAGELVPGRKRSKTLN